MGLERTALPTSWGRIGPECLNLTVPPMMMRLQQMPSDAKEILHESMHGQESLRLPRSFKLPHLSFPLSRRFVRDFG